MKPLIKKRSKLFEECITKSWWVILFFLVCYFFFDHASRRRNFEKEHLSKKLADLNIEKKRASWLNISLKEQIASQNDPAWIELVLMKSLGLVPEGEKKVCFTQERHEADSQLSQ